MTDRLVFNINFYLYIRFVFGFYHEFEASQRVRWLARCYCFIFSATIVILLCHIINFFYPISLVYTLTTAEYILYVLISMYKNNKYLLEYYKKIPFVDNVNITTYKPMHVWLIGYICVLFFVRLISFIQYLISNYHFGILILFYNFMGSITWCAIVLGRLPVLFLLALLYTRMRLMRKMLENNVFESRNHGRQNPRQFIQMYEAIMDSLEKTDDPMKLQVLVFVVFSSIFSIIVILCNLYLIRENNTSGVLITSDFLKLLFDTALGYSPLLLTAILSDMVTMEVQEILALILERRMACNNERDRAEVQKLFQLVKDRPFEYSLWRVVPLNLRSLLSFLSFCVTTIIAILQINSLNSTT